MSDEYLTGYNIIRLSEMLEQLGEERVKKILSSFSSPLNEDIEYFLHHKAIEFDIQSISKTHLVFASFKKKPVLVGYFTLAIKYFSISKKNTTSNLRRKLNRFGKYNTELKAYNLSAPLIAQLGKNYTNGYDELITGGELLGMAVEVIKDIQLSIGGKIIYIECEDKAKLIDFYEQNGFKQFSERELDRSDKINGDRLIQMLKVL